MLFGLFDLFLLTNEAPACLHVCMCLPACIFLAGMERHGRLFDYGIGMGWARRSDVDGFDVDVDVGVRAMGKAWWDWRWRIFAVLFTRITVTAGHMWVFPWVLSICGWEKEQRRRVFA